MARFNLNNRNALKDLGAVIRVMGARIAAFGFGSERLAAQQSEAEERFQSYVADDIVFENSLEAAQRQRERALNAGVGKGGIFVQFHFDQTLEESDGGPFKIVNVVVNDFHGKLVTEGGNVVMGDDGEPLTDLNGVAEESLGFIVFARCG